MKKKFLDNNIIGIQTGILPSNYPSDRNRDPFYKRKLGIFEDNRSTIFPDGEIPIPRSYPLIPKESIVIPPEIFRLSNNVQGLCWDGGFLRILDATLFKVITFSLSPLRHVPALDFDIDGIPGGITWDGTYFRVIGDSTGDDLGYIWTYTYGGERVESADIRLTTRISQRPTGITWDGTYFRVSNSRSVGVQVTTYFLSGGESTSRRISIINADIIQGIAYSPDSSSEFSGPHLKILSSDSTDSNPGSPQVFEVGLNDTSPNLGDWYSLEGTNRAPTGIAYVSGSFYVFDRVTRQLSRYSTTTLRDPRPILSIENLGAIQLTIAEPIPPEEEPFGYQGITWSFTDNRFYCIDWENRRIYTLDSSGNYLSSEDADLPSEYVDPRGISAESLDYVAIVDGALLRAFVLDVDFGSNEGEVFLNSQNRSPRGIDVSHPDDYFRVVDYSRVFAYDFFSTSEEVQSLSFDLAENNRSSQGITWDGTYFRVVDRANLRVYTYEITGVYRSFNDFLLNSANKRPTGITWDGTYFRIIDEGAAKVFTYDSVGIYTPSEDFLLPNAPITQGQFSGICFENNRFRMVINDNNNIFDRVFAYDSSGVSLGSLDFDLNKDPNDPLLDNNFPIGIEWDGTYFRVIDRTDNQVYAYDLTGNFISSRLFLLAPNIDSPRDICFDGNLLRVISQEGSINISSYNLDGTDASGGILQGILTPGNNFLLRSPKGLAWDGTYFRILAELNDPLNGGFIGILAFDSSFNWDSSRSFGFSNPDTQFEGMTWDGTYFRLMDISNRKIVSFLPSGTYVPSADIQFPLSS